MNERDIARAEWLEDNRDEDIVKLREQILILKEHQYALETMLKHQGIELHDLKENIARLRLSI